VQIIGGSFQGLHAVVARVMPGRERVAVLMEFLGRQTSIELPASTIIKPGQERTVIL
jgi:transcription antitermination factor NusG